MVLHGPGLYACKDHAPRVQGDCIPIQTRVQRGWTRDGRRRMEWHTSRFAPVECGHVDSATDPRCGDCRWRRHE